MVIAPHTAYGVPQDQYYFFVQQISQIFLPQNITTWDHIDSICTQYLIDAIIVTDIDPLWSSLPTLEQQRSPLYHNSYYAILTCGKVVSQKHKP